MNNQEVKDLVIYILQQSGVKIPVELKYDLSGLEEPEKMKEFLEITDGDLEKAIYVSKEGERGGDHQYFDLVFAINLRGEPVCVPVPVLRKMLNKGIWADGCKALMTGEIYEFIYAYYYANRSLPF